MRNSRGWEIVVSQSEVMYEKTRLCGDLQGCIKRDGFLGALSRVVFRIHHILF